MALRFLFVPQFIITTTLKCHSYSLEKWSKGGFYLIVGNHFEMIIIQSRNKIINQDRQDQLEPARHLNILWPVWPSLSSHNIIRLLRDHRFSRRPPVFSSSSRGVSTDLAVLRRPWKLWPAPIRPASNSSLQVSLIRKKTNSASHRYE